MKRCPLVAAYDCDHPDCETRCAFRFPPGSVPDIEPVAPEHRWDDDGGAVPIPVQEPAA